MSLLLVLQDDDSDVECELEASPAVSVEASVEAVAHVKVRIQYQILYKDSFFHSFDIVYLILLHFSGESVSSCLIVLMFLKSDAMFCNCFNLILHLR